VTFDRYAVRRLNPFAGVVQVVAGDNARAISLDGRAWEIQVLAEAPKDCWGSPSEHHGALRFFRFGIWTGSGGLRKVPVNPIMDIGAMLDASSPVIDALSDPASRPPFDLADTLELWLLDHHRQPLALLATATPGEPLAALQQRRWCAAPLDDRNLGPERTDGESPAADELEIMVRRNATGAAKWIRRTAPGSGPGHATDGDDQGPIPAHAFPELPVRDQWPSEAEQALMDRWIQRAAPRLLCLPYLDDATRARLEPLAREQAVDVDMLWRLYPRLMDNGFVKAARIEARLRTSSARG
jgi:hypothetical protein